MKFIFCSVVYFFFLCFWFFGVEIINFKGGNIMNMYVRRYIVLVMGNKLYLFLVEIRRNWYEINIFLYNNIIKRGILILIV